MWAEYLGPKYIVVDGEHGTEHTRADFYKLDPPIHKDGKEIRYLAGDSGGDMWGSRWLWIMEFDPKGREPYWYSYNNCDDGERSPMHNRERVFDCHIDNWKKKTQPFWQEWGQKGKIDRAIKDYLGYVVVSLAKGVEDYLLYKEDPSLLARVNKALLDLFGTEEKGKIWLNTPNPEFDGRCPQKLIEDGKSDIVAELLEDALLGHPG